MKKHPAALVLAALAGANLLYAAGAPKLEPQPKDGKEWNDKHEAYVKTARKGGIDLLFVGDSITEYWSAEGKEVWKKVFEPQRAAQFGIAADKVENILWRLQHGELDKGLKPKALVLLGGINNSWGCKREETKERAAFIAAGIEEIVETVRGKLPETKIIVLAVFPLEDGRSPCVKLVNKNIAKLDDGKKVFFLDIGRKLADKQGDLSRELTKDGTHLNEEGYQVWADAMAEAFKKRRIRISPR
ncbi:GDSL-type esterase/lipase family protein [Verrucomicrobiota bacterium]